MTSRCLWAAAMAAAVAFGPTMAFAQTATTTASNGLSCARDRAGSNLTCSAGEFTTIVNLTTPPGSPTTCVAGSTLSLNLIVNLSGTNANRYDGAMFVGQAGNDPRSAGGQCSVSRFPILSTGTGFTSFDGDTCGDYVASGVETWRIDNVQVRCEGDPTTGLLRVPYLLSYQQNDPPGVCGSDSSTLLAPGSPSKCNAGTATVPTLVVRGYVRVTKQTVPDGAAGSFAFTAASSLGTPSPTAFNLSDNQSQLVEVNVTGTPRTLTISEALLPGWESAASIVCTNPSGGAAPYVSVNNATRTITANLDAANFGAECTITNTRLPTVTLTKTSVGGVGTFGFTGTNGIAAQTITTVTSGTPVSGATQTLTAASTATTIAENAPPSGFALSAITCSGLGAGGSATPNLGARSVTLDAAATAAGSNIACTFTNVRLPTATIAKTSVGGVGTFGFTGTNGIAAQTITTVTSGTPVSGATQTLTAASTATTIAENAPPSGFALSAITCSGLGAGGSATPNLGARSVTLDAAATAPGSNIACTFTNTRLPILRLQKSLPNGRFVAADQFALGIAGSGGPANVTTTGSGTAANGVAILDPASVGATYTFSETGAAGANLANYTTTYTCANALSGGQTPSGGATSFALTAAPGDDLTCTFVNTRRPLAELVITKTNTPGFGPNDQPGDTVASGAVFSYSIVVANAGPDSANGAVVTDPAPVGSTCATATCSASGGATCPVATGAALVSALQGAGASIPNLPSAGSVTITLSCVVP